MSALCQSLQMAQVHSALRSASTPLAHTSALVTMASSCAQTSAPVCVSIEHKRATKMWSTKKMTMFDKWITN